MSRTAPTTTGHRGTKRRKAPHSRLLSLLLAIVGVMPHCPQHGPPAPKSSCSLYVSSDAGTSWQEIKTGYDLSVTGIMAWDSNVLLFGRGSFLRSTDHGTTWQRVAPPDWDAYLYSSKDCRGGQLIPGVDGGSTVIYAWCDARLLKVRVRGGGLLGQTFSKQSLSIRRTMHPLPPAER